VEGKAEGDLKMNGRSSPFGLPHAIKSEVFSEVVWVRGFGIANTASEIQTVGELGKVR
jgi:hypothetical protein